MPVPSRILERVELFDRNKGDYFSQNYNEARLREEFVNLFFEELGWDVRNLSGKAEAYKDVIHEDALKIGGTTKAPDYSFRIGGTRKFFLETKKPSVNIHDDAKAAYQIRRYSWSAKLPLAILTDFEEFAVYDCRQKPLPADSASVGRILYFTNKQYAEKWDEIASIFSKTAIEQGSFDTYAESMKGKRGTSEVDDEFLRDIERWREELAKNLALRHGGLSVPEINFVVQKTIDRIIFLRMCEDRGIEPYGQLQALLEKEDIHKELVKIYERCDEKYNSGLFHFREEKDRKSIPDFLSPALHIDDKVLKDIIKSLYYPNCPYVFSVIGADILGNVYEQFLGKVIRLTEGHRAKVEEKPEVKKAGGVYYTPKYIVEYIVENTVGKLIKDKSPKQISEIKILDPACGSGSFLIQAYQYLLDYHRDWYVSHGPEKYGDEIFQGGGGLWYLTLDEKKRILLNNIHGVDIDGQAVEVTKLNLLLKVLEDEHREAQKRLGGRVLPDLDNNIKCGNSLIGPEFYTSQPTTLSTEEQYRINAFDWNKEFPFKFDAVIGNPPYIRIQTMKEWTPVEVEIYKQRYIAASIGNYDLYVVFLERALSLLNEHGILGFILPHKFFQAKFGQPIRQLLSQKKALVEVVHFGAEQVFQNATTYTCLLFLSPTPHDKFRFVSVKSLVRPTELFTSIHNASQHPTYTEVMLSQPPVGNAEWNFSAGKEDAILKKLQQQPLTLGDITRKIFVGLQTSADKIYVLRVIEWRKQTVLCYSKSLEQNVEIERGLVKSFLMGKDIHRYEPAEAKNVVIFPYVIEGGKAVLMSNEFIQKRFPRGYEYLLNNKNELAGREKGKMRGNEFYAYIYPKNLTEFEAAKIMTPEIALGCQLTFDAQGIFYHTTKVYSFIFKDSQKESPLFFLGVLNSKLLWLFLKATGYALRGGYFTFKTEYLKPFYIRTINFHDPADVARHDHIVSLVSQMLDLHKRRAAARTPDEKTMIQRQIEAADVEIDKLVYELYGLTNEEIRIVEGGNDGKNK